MEHCHKYVFNLACEIQSYEKQILPNTQLSMWKWVLKLALDKTHLESQFPTVAASLHRRQADVVVQLS